jgi:hypothetical protein
VPNNVRYASDSDQIADAAGCRLSADTVAKRFFASQRATLIQGIDLLRKNDSSDVSIGFDSCALGGHRQLLQQNLPIGDELSALQLGLPSVMISGR